ncbi:hypothetical protein AVEN_6192-1 [Araneus ventricosus]|uniref:Uncharacterized protein n=1 Tax=Araneus ventricosus TaxID=182803 RepID=A0A4Y2PHZ1_ARAVE|nr:hypothetical protein AVEN_6192-1 [Araneus ventricosus]
MVILGDAKTSGASASIMILHWVIDIKHVWRLATSGFTYLSGFLMLEDNLNWSHLVMGILGIAKTLGASAAILILHWVINMKHVRRLSFSGHTYLSGLIMLEGILK